MSFRGRRMVIRKEEKIMKGKFHRLLALYHKPLPGQCQERSKSFFRNPQGLYHVRVHLNDSEAHQFSSVPEKDFSSNSLLLNLSLRKKACGSEEEEESVRETSN